MPLFYEKWNKKRKKTRSKNYLNQEDLHKFVKRVELNLEDFLQIIIRIPRIRSFIKSKIIIAIFF